MKEIKDHMIEGDAANDGLRIMMPGLPDEQSGAYYRYEITGFDARQNPAFKGSPVMMEAGLLTIVFQHGPVKEHRRNGISEEALLAILIDRYKAWACSGPMGHVKNQLVLEHLSKALVLMQERTADRVARGVEGTAKL